MTRPWSQNTKSGRQSGVREPLLPGNNSSNAPASEEDVEQGPPEAPQTASILRLLRETKPEAFSLSIATFFLLIGSLANLAVPKIAGGLIDACTQAASGVLTPAQAHHVLNQQLTYVIGILVAGGIASGLRAYMFNAAAERVMCRLRVQLFSQLVKQEVAFFDTTPVGELSNRLSEDTRAMKDAATTSLSMALRSLVTVILGAVMMFLTSWKLALLTCATLPFMLLQFRAFARLNKKYVTSQLTAAAAASATAQEVLAGIRTVKSFAKEQQIISTYGQAASDILNWGIKSSVASGVFTGVGLPFAYGCMMLVLWYGAVLVLQGAMSLGDLNAFMLYAIYVAGSAGGLAGTAASVIAAVGAGKRVFQLMDRVPQLPPSGSQKPTGSPAGAALDFQAVSFAYPSRPTSWVLKDFSLQVHPGQSVALVGSSGGGKSTVVKLVQRFYDPQQGRVLFDGVPLSQIDNVFLHQSVALVAQEPLVFADSIKSNILFGVHRTNVTQAEIEAAAIAAHAHDFITALPKGYNSKVGEQGVMLSGGQKQRLAIARALLTQPRLLLLDEATSALDAESEHLVQQALQEAARGRTVMVIAHRLSTVRGADLVAVVQQGQIIEGGTHASLMAEGGAYSQLVQRQVFAGGEQGSSGALASLAQAELQEVQAETAGQVMQDTAAGSGVFAGGFEGPSGAQAEVQEVQGLDSVGQVTAGAGATVTSDRQDAAVPSVSEASASEVLPAPVAGIVAAAGSLVAPGVGAGAGAGTSSNAAAGAGVGAGVGAGAVVDTSIDADVQSLSDATLAAGKADVGASSSDAEAATNTTNKASSQPTAASGGEGPAAGTSGSSTAHEGANAAQPSGGAVPPGGNVAAPGAGAAGAGGRGKKAGKGGRKKK